MVTTASGSSPGDFSGVESKKKGFLCTPEYREALSSRTGVLSNTCSSPPAERHKTQTRSPWWAQRPKFHSPHLPLSSLPVQTSTPTSLPFSRNLALTSVHADTGARRQHKRVKGFFWHVPAQVLPPAPHRVSQISGSLPSQSLGTAKFGPQRISSSSSRRSLPEEGLGVGFHSKVQAVFPSTLVKVTGNSSMIMIILI